MSKNYWEESTVKVLIVDDSKIMLERLKGMLSEVPKAETIGEAKDQQEARELLGKLNPDVVITDIHTWWKRNGTASGNKEREEAANIDCPH